MINVIDLIHLSVTTDMTSFFAEIRNLLSLCGLTEAVVWRCSVKKSVLKNFAKFTGILLCQRLFFDKLAGLGPSTLFKKYSDTGFFLWLLWNSEEHRFCRTFQWLLPKPLSPSSAKLMSDNLCLTTKRISLYLVPRAMSAIFDFTENNT